MVRFHPSRQTVHLYNWNTNKLLLNIQLGDKDWGVLVYYNVGEEDMTSVIDSLESLDCTEEDIHAAAVTLRKENTGFTYTNTDYKMTFVCIGHSSNVG